ncbi:MAG: ATP-binding protein, partial [Egibacteraceae bacterium]
MGRRPAETPALIGCHAAQRLLRRVEADPEAAPAALGIVGRGGTGKSALLDGLARVYTEAGMRVWRHAPARSDVFADPPTGGAPLADDAQWLTDSAPQTPIGGAPLVDDAQWLTDSAPQTLAGGALLVDDAQWLTDGALRTLAGLAGQRDGLRLVVAHRPW